jgi:ring-1,2-phenylacetyl-CoA epoxidase subunit PaaD
MVSARETAGSVRDPELPMLTIEDLGILRGVREDGDAVTVTITPTYSGCPAMREIAADLRLRLQRAGYRHIEITTELSPPWTTAWITPEGRRKLAAAGIAPPSTTATPSAAPIPLTLTRAPVLCPRCGSADTRETARFSGMACKALYQCRACLEPFEYVKEF